MTTKFEQLAERHEYQSVIDQVSGLLGRFSGRRTRGERATPFFTYTQVPHGEEGLDVEAQIQEDHNGEQQVVLRFRGEKETSHHTFAYIRPDMAARGFYRRTEPGVYHKEGRTDDGREVTLNEPFDLESSDFKELQNILQRAKEELPKQSDIKL